jgi:hypothetical protein
MDKITEDIHLEKEWFKKAEGMSLEELPYFLTELMEHQHDYGGICHAIAAGALSTMYAMDKHKNGGITGFQASCALWDVIRECSYSGNKTGLRLVDYDNMLYPQYEYKFQKTINESTWSNLIEQAKDNLSKSDGWANTHVIEHWKSIVDGKVPFGYIISED